MGFTGPLFIPQSVNRFSPIPSQMHRSVVDTLITAYSQVPRNTLVLSKTLSMKDARREAEIPPHIEHHLYEMANPDFMHLGAAGLIQ
jgi:hypothetical protein